MNKDNNKLEEPNKDMQLFWDKCMKFVIAFFSLAFLLCVSIVIEDKRYIYIPILLIIFISLCLIVYYTYIEK